MVDPSDLLPPIPGVRTAKEAADAGDDLREWVKKYVSTFFVTGILAISAMIAAGIDVVLRPIELLVSRLGEISESVFTTVLSPLNTVISSLGETAQSIAASGGLLSPFLIVVLWSIAVVVTIESSRRIAETVRGLIPI